MSDSKNLITAMFEEITRAREILKMYEEIPTGAFGAAVIRQMITDAEKAIASGDVIEMLVRYENLKTIQ